jgi:hypothetical protein
MRLYASVDAKRAGVCRVWKPFPNHRRPKRGQQRYGSRLHRSRVYNSAMWVLMIWLATIALDECCKPTRVGIVPSYGAAQTIGQPDKKEPISREGFLAIEWRSGSDLSSAGTPIDGFPISFGADGSVESRNLGEMRWSLTDGILELSYRNSQPEPRVRLRFEWREPGVFWSCSPGAMLIAPKPIFAKEWKSSETRRCR